MTRDTESGTIRSAASGPRVSTQRRIRGQAPHHNATTGSPSTKCVPPAPISRPPTTIGATPVLMRLFRLFCPRLAHFGERSGHRAGGGRPRAKKPRGGSVGGAVARPAQDSKVERVVGCAAVFERDYVVDVEVSLGAAVLAQAAGTDERASARVLPLPSPVDLPPRFLSETPACGGTCHG
jgi:hypothetical protein